VRERERGVNGQKSAGYQQLRIASGESLWKCSALGNALTQFIWAQ